MAGEDKELYTYVKKCADCGSKRVMVTNCRERTDGVFWRSKICMDCGYTFKTVEMEECMSDIDGLLQEIESLKNDKAALEERIRNIKDYVRRV